MYQIAGIGQLTVEEGKEIKDAFRLSLAPRR
jgi:hypothetical protein